VNARQFAPLLGVAVVTTWTTLLSAPILIASASAASCPDVEVTFARGTNEPPGVGGVGQAFIDSLRSQVGGRSIGVYPVNYPASDDFAPSASAGAPMRTLTFSPWLRIVPTPGWCSVDIPKARW
jgi:cutinase